MNKRKKKQAFPSVDSSKRSNNFRDSAQQTIYEGENVGGVLGFFRDYGVRETIESILIAVVLALMFRAYEAEAFIIPTGSMAPTLQGQHMDLHCEKCNHQFRAGASEESSSVSPSRRNTVMYAHCPLCRYKMRMKRNRDPDHRSFNGDRILVNKFVYDFAEPQRWDVIVFKNPNNGKQNYIKRLVGLPGENLLIDNGDIYSMEPDGNGGWTNKKIVRKPPDKVKAILQLVDDTDFVAPQLREVQWPSRWDQWSDKRARNGWDITESNNKSHFHLQNSNQTNWLRYRHLHPRASDWETIETGNLPNHIKQNQDGRLINDYYCYNDQEYQKRHPLGRNTGAHWVGDIAVEGWFEIKSNSGILSLGLVEGGAHFVCSIDLASGTAELSCSQPTVKFTDEAGQLVATPAAKTSVKEAGKYHIMMANIDDEIFLWVDNRHIEFDAPTFVRSGHVIPKWSPEDAGDAEPAGIGGKNIDMTVTRLKVLRDVYYSSTTNQQLIRNEAAARFGLPRIREIQEDPRMWDSDEARQLFTFEKGKQRPMFPLAQGQFLPMGDNSPASLDGRVWDGPRYVSEDMLIGRAMFIYWPHSLNKPVKYFPNFGRMGFIR